VVDALQGFSAGNATGILGTILISWMIWPIVCGLLGARRGLGLRGAAHGLLWGPIGLPIVLFSRSKQRCPTCGHRTLTTAPQRPVPHAIVMPSDWSAKDAAPPTAEVVASAGAEDGPARSVGEPMPETERQRIIREACTGYSEEEQARLLAWVNGWVE